MIFSSTAPIERFELAPEAKQNRWKKNKLIWTISIYSVWRCSCMLIRLLTWFVFFFSSVHILRPLQWTITIKCWLEARAGGCIGLALICFVSHSLSFCHKVFICINCLLRQNASDRQTHMAKLEAKHTWIRLKWRSRDIQTACSFQS